MQARGTGIETPMLHFPFLYPARTNAPAQGWPRGRAFALVAQLVEHGSNKPRVGGSSPSWSTLLLFFCNHGVFYGCARREHPFRSYSVMVITKDSESFDPGSSPGRTCSFFPGNRADSRFRTWSAALFPSLWPNWIRRLTTNQKIGGSSPSRDIFYFLKYFFRVAP